MVDIAAAVTVQAPRDCLRGAGVRGGPRRGVGTTQKWHGEG